MSGKTRLYLVILHRGSQIIWTRHYSEFTNATKRATEIAIQECQVGDKIEFAHAVSGIQLAVLQVTATGKILLDWSESLERINLIIADYKIGLIKK